MGCKKGFREIKGRCVKIAKRYTGSSGHSRNPFKIWQSYLGALVFGLIPIPLGFAFISPLYFIFRVLITFNSIDFPVNILFLVIGLLPILAGFFFGAALRRGKDGFFKYGVIFTILAIILIWLLNTGKLGGLQ